MAKSILEKFEEELKCSSCQELLSDPKTLPCLHSFCKDCLDGYARGRIPDAEDPTDTRDGVLPCPLCNYRAPLTPGEGVAGIRTNHCLKNLVEHLKLEKQVMGREVESVCGRCEEEDNRATAFCQDCNELLCAVCTQGHRRDKGTKRHQVAALDEVRSLANSGNSDTGDTVSHRTVWKCELHYQEGKDDPNDKRMDMCMYCNDCKEVICCMCALAGHSSHSKEMANAVINLPAHRPKIIAEVSETEGVREKVYETFARVYQRKEDIETARKDTDKQIEEQYDRISAELEQQKDHLLSKIETIYEKHTTMVQCEIEPLERRRKNLEQALKFVERRLDLGMPEDILYLMDEMVERMTTLYKETKFPPEKILETGEITFVEGKLAITMGTVSAEPCIEVFTADDLEKVPFVKGLEAEFTITGRDITHQVMEASDHTVLIELYPEYGPAKKDDIIYGKVEIGMDGKCHVTVTPQKTGGHYLSIQVEDTGSGKFKHIQNSPHRVEVNAHPKHWVWEM